MSFYNLCPFPFVMKSAIIVFFLLQADFQLICVKHTQGIISNNSTLLLFFGGVFCFFESCMRAWLRKLIQSAKVKELQKDANRIAFVSRNISLCESVCVFLGKYALSSTSQVCFSAVFLEDSLMR